MMNHTNNAKNADTLDLLLRLADVFALIDKYRAQGWRARRRDSFNLDDFQAERAAIMAELVSREREAAAHEQAEGVEQ